MNSPKIAFICASLRKESINKKLESGMIRLFEKKGAKTHVINLNEFQMPIFHGDLKIPENVKSLTKLLETFDGIVITTPEYNGCLPPLLKNMIDWTSADSIDYIKNAIWGIASATPGPMSGIMCMRQLNFILNRLGGEVLSQQVGCGNAASSLDSDGNLISQPALNFAEKMCEMMIKRIDQKK